MTIRAKLYLAIALTVLGPLATIAVALHGQNTLDDRFDEVQERAAHRALALELKFGMTDVNGWQTVWGYDDGASRPIFERSVADFRRDLREANERLTEPRERQLLREFEAGFADFMRLDERSWNALQEGREEVTKRILLGPELEIFEETAGTAERLAAYETQQAGGNRGGLRRRSGRRAPAADRSRARRRRRDRAAAAHRERPRAPGARGRASEARAAGVTDDVLLTLSLLLIAALVARLLASLLRVPEILLLVALGALLGPSVLDVVDVPFESLGAQLMFTLGVSLILFYGGLTLSLPLLRKVWVSLGMLAVPGIVITTLIVGVAAHFAFDLSWSSAFLVGAVLSPTDPAILIPLFARSRLRPKVAQTVIAESALNDPTGAALALALAGIVLTGESSVAEPVTEFAVDLGISTVLGIVAGVLLSAAIASQRSGVWRESSAIAVLAVVTISFFSLDSAGGSGYLGAFLAGLIVGNMEHLGLAMHSPHEVDTHAFAFNLADIVTLIVFVVLGANIPFDDLGGNLLPALAVLAVLMLIARPITVLACVMPDRGGAWERNEIAFLCWTRETGVIPAALVGVLAGLGVPHIDVLASVVALAIVLTLLLQALPAPWLAGRLGLLEPRTRAVPHGAG